MRFVGIGLILATLFAWPGVLAAERVEVIRRATIREVPRGTGHALSRVDEGIFELARPDRANGWYEIRLGEGTGWIYSRSVRLLSDEGNRVALGSFNTLHLGWGQTKSIETVAAVVGRYDVAVLLEVMKLPILATLEDELEKTTSADWQWVASEPLGRSTYKEHCVFMWRTDRVRLVPESMHIVPDPNDGFLREPCVADFRAGSFDFTVIAVHFVFGDPPDRAAEAEEIARVFRNVQEANVGENDVVLVGDFNLEPDDAAWVDLKAIPGMDFVVRPPLKTSLSDNGLVHLYDNVWFQAQALTEYDQSAGAYDFVDEMFDGDYASGKRAVSDHLPVWARFRTDGVDDD